MKSVLLVVLVVVVVGVDRSVGDRTRGDRFNIRIPDIRYQKNRRECPNVDKLIDEAVTKALRSYQQKLDLTTRLPPTQPPPKGKDEKLQELVQDTRSKIASMLKIIDKAAEDGKIPENLADEIDLNTPGILVQLSELEQLLGKDPNEPEKALPTKPDGTTDWGKILHGRDPPTGTRAPKKGKPKVVKASDDGDEE